MSDDDLQALLRAARRVADGELLTSELMGQERVPVPLRLVVAVVALTAADQAVSKTAVLAAAPAARSATYRDHAELLEEARTALPALVRAQLSLVGREVNAADLAAQLQEAHRTILEERVRRERAEADLAQVASYARELHWQLKPEREELLRERAEKVRTLRPVPPTEAGDGS